MDRTFSCNSMADIVQNYGRQPDGAPEKTKQMIDSEAEGEMCDFCPLEPEYDS